MKLIQQSMLIRDTADNIFAALTSPEDLRQWWGLVNEKADGVTVWHGMDRQYPVPIVAIEPGRLISFALDSHHPYDADRIEPTTISITIAERGNVSVVTVVQSMFSDDDWNTLIHDGWAWALLSLQLWVERGIAFPTWTQDPRYHTITKVVPLARDAWWAWNALTNGTTMGRWLEAEVTSDPVVGGQIGIRWSDDSKAAGAWTLLSEPRNLVCHWWDASSLAERNDPGVTTVQQWTVLPAVNGSIVRLVEYGHDRNIVSEEWIGQVEAGWDRFLANLQALAAEPQ